MGTLERLTKMLVEHLGIELHQVTPEAKFEEDLGGDSLDRVEIVMDIEEHFKVEIEDDEAVAFVTVADMVELIDRKTAADRAA